MFPAKYLVGLVLGINNRFILQFGRKGNSSTDFTVTFPVSFSTCFSVVAEQYVNATGQSYTHSTKIKSKAASSFSVYSNCSAICWIATGC